MQAKLARANARDDNTSCDHMLQVSQIMDY